MRQPPEAYSRLVAKFAETPPMPERGQVWRARWDKVADVVLLTGVSSATVEAVPLSIETELADDSAVHLSADEQPLGYDVVAWMGLAQSVPVRILDVMLGEVPDATLNGLADRPVAGVRIVASYDDRGQVRDAIADRLKELATATWLPEDVSHVDLRELMQARGLTTSQVAKQLGMEPGSVTSIIRGDRSPTGDQAAALAALLQVDNPSAFMAPISADLVSVIDLPAYRKRLATLAERQGVPDEAAWRRQVATGELATAARITGGADAKQRWVVLLEDYLRANGV